MNMQEFTQPAQLERNSFLWSELRLLVAAIALFIGGTPLVYKVFSAPSLAVLISPLLTLAWIISGAASAYLLYRWYLGKQVLFGRKVPLDTVVFFVSVVSGINLGLVGLTGTNIGMSISSNTSIFLVVGLLYLASAGYLYKRWLESGRRLF